MTRAMREGYREHDHMTDWQECDTCGHRTGAGHAAPYDDIYYSEDHDPDQCPVPGCDGRMGLPGSEHDEVRDEVRDALHDGSERSMAIVAEAFLRDEVYVPVRHTVSPGGLRFASAAELGWMDNPPARGHWLLGTGVVVARPTATPRARSVDRTWTGRAKAGGRLDQIAKKLMSDEAVCTALMRWAGETGVCRCIPAGQLNDWRPATPRRMLAALTACASKGGYGGRVLRDHIIGCGVGCDAATVASVHAVIGR